MWIVCLLIVDGGGGGNAAVRIEVKAKGEREVRRNYCALCVIYGVCVHYHIRTLPQISLPLHSSFLLHGGHILCHFFILLPAFLLAFY